MLIEEVVIQFREQLDSDVLWILQIISLANVLQVIASIYLSIDVNLL